MEIANGSNREIAIQYVINSLFMFFGEIYILNNGVKIFTGWIFQYIHFGYVCQKIEILEILSSI
jgi:hypothetical protein